MNSSSTNNPPANEKRFSDLDLEIRKAGLTQSELAQRLNLHRNTVSLAIRKGMNKPTVAKIENLLISLN